MCFSIAGARVLAQHRGGLIRLHSSLEQLGGPWVCTGEVVVCRHSIPPCWPQQQWLHMSFVLDCSSRLRALWWADLTAPTRGSPCICVNKSQSASAVCLSLLLALSAGPDNPPGKWAILRSWDSAGGQSVHGSLKICLLLHVVCLFLACMLECEGVCMLPPQRSQMSGLTSSTYLMRFQHCLWFMRMMELRTWMWGLAEGQEGFFLNRSYLQPLNTTALPPPNPSQQLTSSSEIA